MSVPIPQLADKPQHIFIWGMGLMGASLALRLKEAGHRVSGAVRSSKSQQTLTQMGLTDILMGDTECIQALEHADILVLGLNLNDCYRVLSLIAAHPTLGERLAILDLCSTKAEIMAHVRTYYPHLRFIGTHPMAGKEIQGPQAAERTLYENAAVFITPPEHLHAAIAQDLTRLAADIWSIAGAHTATINAVEHDRMMAAVSHGLHLNACLIALLSASGAGKNIDLSPAAGSYRDMTRIVQSSGKMWAEIIHSNRQNTSAWLRALADAANELATGIDQQTVDIAVLFEKAQAVRTQVMRT
ncbi:MAG: prephenate dehydrogenase/arogenate dehydrogenase family protein [Spirochaetes bacterium]|nr:prephenate dehydrogenase/arogenate dehydrogenase family protein [Spirochaetota bacterium]